MIIRIKALDTLFFRDGKPFNMADESWATGIFPPPPSVLYGALRSAFLSQKGFNSNNIKISENLKIRNLFFEQENINNGSLKRIHWAPYDLSATDLGNKIKQKIHLLHLRMSKNINSQKYKFKYQLFPPEKKEGVFLNVDTVGGPEYLVTGFEESYVKTGNLPKSLIQLSKVITTEPKVGIGRNNYTHVSDESALYRVGMQRLAGNQYRLNIIIDFDGLDLAPSGVLKIGGEGKSAFYKIYHDRSIQIPFPTLEKDIFKLYLATPALFENGWRPSWLSQDGSGNYKGIELQLLTAAIGKPIHIGGFDIRKKEPKPMLKAVPPGTVYYFKLLKGGQKELKNAFHQKCISDRRQKEGFGLAFVCNLK
ncbi:MAG: type III-B CRISPR module-associated protein Cmr3 [Chitinophagales bacterium]|nr:type III-B CRISPR module-associated protein Cmr3 [Chitinophagales bacterium]